MLIVCWDVQVSIQERFGLLSLITIGAANLGVATTLRAFPKEKLIVKAERTKKIYGVWRCAHTYIHLCSSWRAGYCLCLCKCCVNACL